MSIHNSAVLQVPSIQINPPKKNHHSQRAILSLKTAPGVLLEHSNCACVQEHFIPICWLFSLKQFYCYNDEIHQQINGSYVHDFCRVFVDFFFNLNFSSNSLKVLFSIQVTFKCCMFFMYFMFFMLIH